MSEAELTHPCGRLMNVSEAAERIGAGAWLWIAGDEALLRSLPRGHWIGGTTPYFMGQEGGKLSREQLFVTEVRVYGAQPWIRFHDVTSLARVCVEAPEQGYSFLIIPAFSAVHSYYARNAPGFEDMFVKPVVGWVAGVHLDHLTNAAPGVINGETGVFDCERALVMHVPLPDDHFARVEIVNLFEQGNGDRIRFPETGFSAGQCLINGQPAHLADYLSTHDIDLSLPLVADYCGAMINVSFKGVDTASRRVDFYAPVFADVEYRLARRRAGGVEPADAQQSAFSCNCILNYLYDRLEGRRTGAFTGPVTFGEIAYLLLNQTLVYLAIERA